MGRRRLMTTPYTTAHARPHGGSGPARGRRARLVLRLLLLSPGGLLRPASRTRRDGRAERRHDAAAPLRCDFTHHARDGSLVRVARRALSAPRAAASPLPLLHC